MRPRFEWQLANRSLELGARTLVMGIVNVTPDSFSDGGRYFDRERAVEHALQLLDQGADLLDIGGESTRPGTPVRGGRHIEKQALSAEEELMRVIPVIAEVKQLRPTAIVSVDTYKAVVAREAVEAGADIVNDVSGLLWDAEMATTCAEMKCGVVLMHMRGTPDTWRSLPKLDDPLGLVKRELRQRADCATKAGIARERIAVDPGFGFGKSLEENYPVLAKMSELAELGFPILAGTSRKSFIGRALAGDEQTVPVSERLSGSLAAMIISILQGAHIVRVHDVKESVQAARVVDAVMATA